MSFVGIRYDLEGDSWKQKGDTEFSFDHLLGDKVLAEGTQKSVAAEDPNFARKINNKHREKSGNKIRWSR